MKRKLLLVGEANPLSRDRAKALWPYPGSAGGRFAAMLGLDPDTYLRHFERVNLYVRPPKRWNRKKARERAWAITVKYRGYDVFLLGQRVADAFLMTKRHFSLWKRYPYFGGSRWHTYMLLPHPSGRCRTWNDPATRERLREAVWPFLWRNP